MKKLKNRNYYRAFALGSVGALMLTASALVAVPELDNRSFAVTCTNNLTEDNEICDTDTTEINVEVEEVLDITAITVNGTEGDDGEADLGTTTPGATTINTNSVTVTVDTNSADGYQLQLEGIKTVEPEDEEDEDDPVNLANNNALINADAPTYTIETLSGTVAAADFTAGRWGYSLDSGANYSAIPASATRVVGHQWATVSGVYTLESDTTFTFGAKPSATQVAGSYEGGVRFTAVAEYGS